MARNLRRGPAIARRRSARDETGKETTTAKTAAKLVAETKVRVENLSVAQVADELAAGNVVLVDIRGPQERADHGFLAGSLDAPAACPSSGPTRPAPTTGRSSTRRGG